MGSYLMEMVILYLSLIHISKLIKDGVLKVEEGQALLDKAGIKDVSAEGLKNGVNEFKLSVTNGLSDAQKKFLEGTGIIGGVDIPGIATAGISASVTGLKQAVATSINLSLIHISSLYTINHMLVI